MNHIRVLRIPAIGQTFSRDLMPQLSDHLEDFLKFLDSHEIKHTEMMAVDPLTLKATQSDGFDYDKIMSIPPDIHKVITSNDSHILDGHHRWLAACNRDNVKICAHEIDLPIMDAVARAKEFLATRQPVSEGITHKEFQPMVDSFVDFASNELGIKSLPGITLKTIEDGEQPSFGGYSPGNKTIAITTKNRHPMDIFRTLAHELVHAKQDEDGRLGKDIEKEGETGSDIENQANSLAGVIMRNYAKKERHMFNSKNLDEQFCQMLEDTPSDREWGKPSLTAKYKSDTPGQTDEESGHLTTATNVGLPKSADGIGPEFAVSNFGPGGLGSPFSHGFGAYEESADKGLLDMGTVPKQGKEEVKEEWKKLLRKKPIFRNEEITEEKPGLWANIRARRASGKKMRKKGEKGAPTDAQIKAAQGIEEESAAWQRKEGKNPEGGLNRKGIASYRKQNPGSKLSMAVTTEPSKLKKGSKSWKRRKSFCARMSGVSGPMKDDKGRPTRKALALRKWNCE